MDCYLRLDGLFLDRLYNFIFRNHLSFGHDLGGKLIRQLKRISGRFQSRCAYPEKRLDFRLLEFHRTAGHSPQRRIDAAGDS